MLFCCKSRVRFSIKMTYMPAERSAVLPIQSSLMKCVQTSDDTLGGQQTTPRLDINYVSDNGLSLLSVVN